jgi:hypothetical protein
MKHQSVLNKAKRLGLTVNHDSGEFAFWIEGPRCNLGWYKQGENTSGALHLTDKENPDRCEIDYFTTRYYRHLAMAFEMYFYANKERGAA